MADATTYDAEMPSIIQVTLCGFGPRFDHVDAVKSSFDLIDISDALTKLCTRLSLAVIPAHNDKARGLKLCTWFSASLTMQDEEL